YTVPSDITLYAHWLAGATGVEDQLQVEVNFYPNPFGSEVRLAGAEGCTLTVVTAAGTVVHTQKVVGSAETIALGKLPSGVYFFRLKKEGKTKTVRRMKIND
ncbi:MAG: T9SS type A sorting domain-containing protein, partial [Prevotellaceae bacterium]|nr:T9SS type A sorting domain-containing protein [Prevotellaceae bacterium]